MLKRESILNTSASQVELTRTFSDPTSQPEMGARARHAPLKVKAGCRLLRSVAEPRSGVKKKVTLGSQRELDCLLAFHVPTALFFRLLSLWLCSAQLLKDQVAELLFLKQKLPQKKMIVNLSIEQ